MAATDIDFVIGAQDRTQPALQNVTQSLDRVAQSAQGVSASTQGAAKAVDVSFKSILQATGVLVAVEAAFHAVSNAIGGFHGSLHAFLKQAEAVEGLQIALSLDSTAASAEAMTEDLARAAAQMQELYLVGDEVSIGLMRQASLLGVQSSNLQDVTQAAIGLSHATGKSLDESLKLVKNAIMGEFGAFGELLPAMKLATTETEKLAMVSALAEKGLNAKAATVDSTGGKLQRMQNNIGDLAEKVGEMLAPAIDRAADAVSSITVSLQGYMQPAIDAVGKAVQRTAQFFEFAFRSLPELTEYAIAAIQLFQVRLGEDMAHLFLIELPEYVSWFSRNFVNLTTDAFNAALTVVTNYVDRAAATLTALWDWIRSGMDGGFDALLQRVAQDTAGSLLDGFKSSVEGLPDIAARAMTSREQQLSDKMAMLGDKIGKSWSQSFNDRVKTTEDQVSKDLALSMQSSLEKPDDKKVGSSGGQQMLSAAESRLLTRGPGSRLTMEDLMKELVKFSRMNVELVQDDGARQAAIESELREAREAIESKGTVMFAEAPT